MTTPTNLAPVPPPSKLDPAPPTAFPSTRRRRSRQILAETRQITASRREKSRSNLEAAKQEARQHTHKQKWQYRQGAKDKADALRGDLSAIEFLSDQYSREDQALEEGRYV